VKGNAVQVWVLIRFLPLLLAGLVTDKKHPAWVMLISLIEILQLITSPFVSRSCIPYIEDKIAKYLTLRSQLFNVPLRPKHHFFEHYGFLLLRFGPLMRCSTLRFESKHKFFRSEFCNKKCLKNPTKSLATAHQRLQSSLHIDDMFARHPIMEDASPLNGLDVDKEIIECLKFSFGSSVASKLLYSSEMEYHNTTYKKGNVAVISGRKNLDIECLKIDVRWNPCLCYWCVTYVSPLDINLLCLSFFIIYCSLFIRIFLQSYPFPVSIYLFPDRN